MGFQAATTSPLDFNFAPYQDVSGTIPDPSEAQVRAFNTAISRLREDARAVTVEVADVDGDLSPEAQERLEEVGRQLHERTIDAVADLCDGTPTREQIAALPYRVQMGFVEWLQEELRNPTTLPATKPPLAAVR